MSSNEPILHILVVGFHHKLGCQIEFSHPPLIPGTTGKSECPSGWKYLPTLALPDGSHNFDEDTVFYNLPSLKEPTRTVYGVSCYRQIPVEKLKIRTADVTRSSVQKSVTVLTRLPIYGYIEVKLALIADAYFEYGDFSCTDILVKAYEELNACLADEAEVRRQRQFYVGLDLREIVLHWRHKTLILFKLFLLQRRVVCFGSPVRPMCGLILSIASLMPRLLEKGFQEVACVRTSRPISPMPDFTDCIQREAEAIEKEKQQQVICVTGQGDSDQLKGNFNKDLEKLDVCSIETSAAASDTLETTDFKSNLSEQRNGLERLNSAESFSSAGFAEHDKRFERSESLTREGSVDALTSLGILSAVSPDEYRAPITIFASGNLCLPYLSLPYMDLLTDPSVLSYVIGTSNVLFQQKRQLADVLVDIENANLDPIDTDLRRQLVLSTEDLRFMDYIMKHVQMPKEDAEGSEHWIRAQFQGYILALLRTAVVNDTTTKEIEHFNSHFMNAFKRTQCFQEWYDAKPDAEFFDALPVVGHPFAGTMSVADMKLKITQTMQNSESGRKINQAVNNTSRAVGGALSQAKGAFSNWWSSMTSVPSQTNLNTNVSNENLISKSSNSPTQVHEISVTFQSSNDECNIEMGVNINIEEGESTQVKKGGNISRNTSSASSAGGSEKLLDSAEELDEDSIKESGVPKPPTVVSENVGAKVQKGIVEIGKEADILDNKNDTIIKKTNIERQVQTFATDAGESNSADSSSDGVFVV